MLLTRYDAPLRVGHHRQTLAVAALRLVFAAGVAMAVAVWLVPVLTPAIDAFRALKL
jgi:hypothetical protein